MIARRKDKVIVAEVEKTYGELPVERGAVALDLGANIGAASLLMLRKGAAKVIAIEPDPGNVLMARRNLHKRPATIIWAAVGPTRGRSKIYVSGDRPYLTSKLRDKGRVAVDVPMVTLGALLSQYRPSIIKCDIEFGEYDLPELTYLPDYVHVLAMEIHVRHDLVVSQVQSDENLREQRRLAAELVETIEVQGFREVRRKDKLAKAGPVKDETGLHPLLKSIDAIWTR